MKNAVRNENINRYTDVDRKKYDGATFTPALLANFVANQMLKLISIEQRPLRILDPAIGDGALIISLLERLGPSLDGVHVYGFDTNLDSIHQARARLLEKYPDLQLTIINKSFLDFVLEQCTEQHMLSCPGATLPNEYDLIIANPPYVRTQIMGAQKAQSLASNFNLSGRVDLYYPFILGIARTLKYGGVAGIITSNRFMTTKSGSSVRRAILKEFHLHGIWDMGDTKLFDAAVLPAVLIGSRKKSIEEQKEIPFTSIYETSSSSMPPQAMNEIEALKHRGVVQVNDQKIYNVKHGLLSSRDPSEVWSISNEETDLWLETVAKFTWKKFKDIGKIRVGVKTCADKVFIQDNWSKTCPNALPELLRPLITHHMAKRFRPLSENCQFQILYPHECINGKKVPVDIKKYPNSYNYLKKHRQKLEQRKYLIEAGRNWFEIWVPHKPDLWNRPKLIFRDISKKPTFWLDFSGSIVNGDCYWMIPNKEDDVDLLWLASAISNSKFIEEFYDHKFNNKLYAGRRRFITQYVEQFPLPDPQRKEAKKLISFAKKIYECSLTDEADRFSQDLDRLVYNSFGLSFEEA